MYISNSIFAPGSTLVATLVGSGSPGPAPLKPRKNRCHAAATAQFCSELLGANLQKSNATLQPELHLLSNTFVYPQMPSNIIKYSFGALATSTALVLGPLFTKPFPTKTLQAIPLSPFQQESLERFNKALFNKYP